MLSVDMLEIRSVVLVTRVSLVFIMQGSIRYWYGIILMKHALPMVVLFSFFFSLSDILFLTLCIYFVLFFYIMDLRITLSATMEYTLVSIYTTVDISPQSHIYIDLHYPPCHDVIVSSPGPPSHFYPDFPHCFFVPSHLPSAVSVYTLLFNGVSQFSVSLRIGSLHLCDY